MKSSYQILCTLFLKYIFYIFLLFSFHLEADFEEEYYNEYFYDTQESTIIYDGMKCCHCFEHCLCSGYYLGEFGSFPSDCSSHPRTSIDKAWHEFVKGILKAKQVGPFFIIDSLYFKQFMRQGFSIHSIPDYFKILEKFKNFISKARIKNIESSQESYAETQDKEKLEKNLRHIEEQFAQANQILDEIPSKIISLYKEVLRNCPHNFLFSIYHKGLIYSLEDSWNESLVEIRNFIEISAGEKVKELDSRVYEIYGKSCLEVHLFHEAINALTIAIKNDPENKQAFFLRAAAYFETGNFDLAIQDYLMTNKESIISVSYKASRDFSIALFKGTYQGASEAAIDFIPSLCSSAYGLGQTFWALHPLNPLVLENAEYFEQACYQMGECFIDYCAGLDWEKFDGYVDQIKILYNQYGTLSEAQKGELIGYVVGRYGVDIFAGGISVKGILAFQNLKNVNRLCNLEAMVVSELNKEKIVASALQHNFKRELFFKNVKIEWGKQNKHIIGKHNYEAKKSILEHSNPEGLLEKLAGTGTPVRGTIGQPGYQEIVNFKENIGFSVCEHTGTKTPTTWGKIHYSKNSAHIVPTRSKL